MKPAKTTTKGTKSGIIAIGEKVVMQTALITMEGENKRVTKKAIFDTGRRQTSGTEELRIHWN